MIKYLLLNDGAVVQCVYAENDLQAAELASIWGEYNRKPAESVSFKQAENEPFKTSLFWEMFNPYCLHPETIVCHENQMFRVVSRSSGFVIIEELRPNAGGRRLRVAVRRDEYGCEYVQIETHKRAPRFRKLLKISVC
ncbi:MAG: hypothetical protein ACO3FL_04385 [Ilumatobacteraceae bacterium]